MIQWAEWEAKLGVLLIQPLTPQPSRNITALF